MCLQNQTHLTNSTCLSRYLSWDKHCPWNSIEDKNRTKHESKWWKRHRLVLSEGDESRDQTGKTQDRNVGGRRNNQFSLISHVGFFSDSTKTFGQGGRQAITNTVTIGIDQVLATISADHFNDTLWCLCCGLTWKQFCSTVVCRQMRTSIPDKLIRERKKVYLQIPYTKNVWFIDNQTVIDSALLYFCLFELITPMSPSQLRSILESGQLNCWSVAGAIHSFREMQR